MISAFREDFIFTKLRICYAKFRENKTLAKISEFTVYKHWLSWTGNVPFFLNFIVRMGAQWLSGRVLDSGPKGRGFEPHRRHCVVVLEQDTFILA